MLPPFILRFFSTAPIQSEMLAAFAAATRTFFGKRHLAGEFTTDTDASLIAFEDAAAFFERGVPEWTGCLTVVFGDSNGLSARCDLLRLRRKRRSSGHLGELAGYRVHEFSIEIAASRRGDAAIQKSVFGYFSQAAEVLKAQFALGHDGGEPLASLHAARGLESGLPGIYRMTAFGSAFVDLIGADRLRLLPVSETKCLRSGAVAVSLGEDLGRASSSDTLAKRDAVRGAIGQDYFADTTASPLGVSGGQVSLWSFIGAALRSKQDYESSDRLAKRRPVLDWSGVFQDSAA